MLGFFELLLISLITLLIVRPERLPTIVKKVVYFVKKIHKYIDKTKTSINKETELEKLKEELSIQEESLDIKGIIEESKDSIYSINVYINESLIHALNEII
jgi:Tat protein translocase TatB subunit